MKNKKKMVFVGLSGGVDSSVAAYILKKGGYEVIAIHGFFTKGKKKSKDEDFRSAQRVAYKLGIKLYTINLISEFKDKVIDYYLREYRQGRTPNPCVVCNKNIKFGVLKDKLLSLDKGFWATGHYVRIKRGLLYRGVDRKKDQSYFLWKLNKKQLKNVVFPLGKLKKSQVKKIAKKQNLPTYDKDESNGACFYRSKGGHKSFIKKYAPELLKWGNVVNKQGKIIGSHKGVAFYTIGQRYGFEIEADKAGFKGEDPPPLYVIKLKPRKNQIVVGKDEELYADKFLADDLNWLANKPAKKGKYLVQIRHGQEPVKANVNLKSSQATIKLRKKVRSIAPGQSVVFYKKDKLMGGGIIEKTL